MITNPMIIDGGAELPGWTQTTLPTMGYWNSVTYGNGKFVAVSETEYAAAYIKDSYDEWA